MILLFCACTVSNCIAVTYGMMTNSKMQRLPAILEAACVAKERKVQERVQREALKLLESQALAEQIDGGAPAEPMNYDRAMADVRARADVAHLFEELTQFNELAITIADDLAGYQEHHPVTFMYMACDMKLLGFVYSVKSLMVSIVVASLIAYGHLDRPL